MRPIQQNSEFHVIANVETDDIALLLPKKLHWCYDELNCYVKTGDFSLSFEMELRLYYDRSIKSPCDNPRAVEELKDLFRAIDEPYGPPNAYE
eukprot:6463398-Amphidinium_carterae.1